MKRPSFYSLLSIILVIAILASTAFLILNTTKARFGKTGVDVGTRYQKAKVFINGKDKGDTPVYTEELLTNGLEVRINGETNSYVVTLRPAAKTLAVVNRDLGVNDTFRSGQNIWFTKTGGSDATLSFISPDTPEVSVIIDDVEIGKTPLKVSTKSLLTHNDEEKYSIKMKKDGYDEQNQVLKAIPGYDLTTRVDMFLRPFPENAMPMNGLSEGIILLNLSSDSNPAFYDTQSRAKAINYWLRTRGAAVSGTTKIEKLSYFITDAGKIYNESGNEIAPADVKLATGMIVGYLAKQPATELSAEAKASVAKLGIAITTTPSGTSGTQVKIKPTGLGFLRVRSGPAKDKEEVGKVNEGTTFALLEEQTGWYKIEYTQGKQGWISAVYAQKIEAKKPAEEKKP